MLKRRCSRLLTAPWPWDILARLRLRTSTLRLNFFLGQVSQHIPITQSQATAPETDPQRNSFARMIMTPEAIKCLVRTSSPKQNTIEITRWHIGTSKRPRTIFRFFNIPFLPPSRQKISWEAVTAKHKIKKRACNFGLRPEHAPFILQVTVNRNSNPSKIEALRVDQTGLQRANKMLVSRDCSPLVRSEKTSRAPNG